MGGYDGHRGRIYSLAVGVKFRRRGITTSLMARVEAELVRLDCQKVNLQVLATNGEVVGWYTKRGYLVEERISLGKLLASSPAG